MRSYYLLGYYTTNAAKDGKYRQITVKLNNKMRRKDGAPAGLLRMTRSGVS